MSAVFVYSFDREQFMGAFPTRADAVAAGLRKADGSPTPITTIYVGQKISPNPRAFGHARALVDRMVARVKQDLGDEADNWLRNLNDGQLTDLDGQLEQTILGWLGKHNLMPQSSKVEAITEHAVPTPMQWRAPGTSDFEVHLVGETPTP